MQKFCYVLESCEKNAYKQSYTYSKTRKDYLKMAQRIRLPVGIALGLVLGQHCKGIRQRRRQAAELPSFHNVEVVSNNPQEATVIERTQSKAASISIGINARAVSAEKLVRAHQIPEKYEDYLYKSLCWTGGESLLTCLM